MNNDQLLPIIEEKLKSEINSLGFAYNNIGIIYSNAKSLLYALNSNKTQVSFNVDKDSYFIKIYNVSSKFDSLKFADVLTFLNLTISDSDVIKFSVDDNEFGLHVYKVESSLFKYNDLLVKKTVFCSLLFDVLNGYYMSDLLNGFIVNEDWLKKDVMLLRCYASYAHQLQLLDKDEMIKLFSENISLSRDLVDFFRIKFDHNNSKAERVKELVKAEVNLLKNHNLGDKTSNSSKESKAFNVIFNLIQATVRTNFFKQSLDKESISIKIKPNLVVNMPKPIMFAEIFVYDPEFEGVHLRHGPVSRGGLRWSDRHNDFRTEILGLARTQVIKNVIIVPTGSKGGFVIRNQEKSDVVNCYKNFLRSLLDVTDNVIDKKSVPCSEVVCYDDIDSYLVVAADKGTGSFSDYANSVSQEYNFWLGDAFASGGSSGYSHKGLGITARGAWESVVRNLHEHNIDVDKDRFNVVGIGSMNGDVFGNGMLLSRKIALVAAFNNNSIIIDPNPDTEISFKERERLFDIPNSSWHDYNEKLISKGGGVFSRDDQNIPISKEMSELFEIPSSIKSMSSVDLIVYIFKAKKIDLLWNGAIGTYVKSENENHKDVGDSSSDKLRINGKEAGFKVVGEGGNLGFTQKGRVEYSLHNGECYTDALDNSAGVSCSDHEVNIKIALAMLIGDGLLPHEERDAFIESLTNDVVHKVLIDNILQSQVVSVALADGVENCSLAIDSLLDYLEKEDVLDREFESFPSRDVILSRIKVGKGIQKPELSVLLSYIKILMTSEISKLDNAFFEERKDIFMDYFPSLMVEKFGDNLLHHQLYKEIIATSIANEMINFIGFKNFWNILESFNYSFEEIIKTYIFVRNNSELKTLIDYLSQRLYGKIPVFDSYKILNLISGIIFESMLSVLSLSRKGIDIDIENIQLISNDSFFASENDDLCSLPDYCKNLDVYLSLQKFHHYPKILLASASKVNVSKKTQISLALSRIVFGYDLFFNIINDKKIDYRYKNVSKNIQSYYDLLSKMIDLNQKIDNIMLQSYVDKKVTSREEALELLNLIINDISSKSFIFDENVTIAKNISNSSASLETLLNEIK